MALCLWISDHRNEERGNVFVFTVFVLTVAAAVSAELYHFSILTRSKVLSVISRLEISVENVFAIIIVTGKGVPEQQPRN